jgi:hypothetical protein
LKLPDQLCGLQFSPTPVTESPSPDTPSLTYSPSTTDSSSETPSLTYSPSTTDSSSETRTVQMMFKDNVNFGGNLSQSWLGASDSPKHNILSTLSSGNCEDGPFFSVAESEAFETHQDIWYESNQSMIRDPIGSLLAVSVIFCFFLYSFSFPLLHLMSGMLSATPTTSLIHLLVVFYSFFLDYLRLLLGLPTLLLL